MTIGRLGQPPTRRVETGESLILPFRCRTRRVPTGTFRAPYLVGVFPGDG